MIWENIKESLIFLGLDGSSRDEILMQMGSALIREGYAKESYVEALIEREKNFPTGLSIGTLGIAIPHTEAKYVEKEGIAIGVLKHAVDFGQMGTDDEVTKVQLVFMLTIKDQGKYVEYLKNLLEVIRDKQVLEQFLDAKSSREMIEIVKEKEKSM